MSWNAKFARMNVLFSGAGSVSITGAVTVTSDPIDSELIWGVGAMYITLDGASAAARGLKLGYTVAYEKENGTFVAPEGELSTENITILYDNSGRGMILFSPPPSKQFKLVITGASGSTNTNFTAELGYIAGAFGSQLSMGAGIGGSLSRFIVTGRKAVTTAGVATQLVSSATPCQKVFLSADLGNSGIIFFGASSVVAANGSQQGSALFGGNISTTIEVDDVSKIWIDSQFNGDGVAFTYLKR